MKSLINFIKNYSAEKKNARFLVVYGIVEGIIPQEKTESVLKYIKENSFYWTLRNYFSGHTD